MHPKEKKFYDGTNLHCSVVDRATGDIALLSQPCSTRYFTGTGRVPTGKILPFRVKFVNL